MNSSNTTGHRVSSGVRTIHSRECVALEWPGLAESQVLCPWQRWLIRVVVNHYDPLWGTLYSVIFCRYYDYKCKYINNYRHIHTHTCTNPKKRNFHLMGFFAMKLPYTEAFPAIIHQSAFASRNPRHEAPPKTSKNPMCSTGANFVGENSWKSMISGRIRKVDMHEDSRRKG